MEGRVMAHAGRVNIFKRFLHIVYAKDYTDPDCINRRLAQRPLHLQRIDKRIVYGGALLKDSKMIGSMMVLDLSHAETVEFVKTDPYTTGKVWETTEILEFKQPKP
jgi:uncharacterized protein YciI